MNSEAVGSTGGGGGGGTEDYILIRDEKPSGTFGGTFTTGAWQTRDLNTEVNDAGGHASLASNQITLAPGTYRVKAHAGANQVNQHKVKLRNITDNVDVIIGTTARATQAFSVATESLLEGRFTIASSKVLELQHRCSITQATSGFGFLTAYGVVEVYSAIEFWKEA